MTSPRSIDDCELHSRGERPDAFECFSESSTEPMGAPVPLRLVPPSFRLECLAPAPALFDFTSAEATYTNQSPSVSMLLGLSCIAAAAGDKFLVECGAWDEKQLNIYCAAALASGERKSASIAHYRSFFDDFVTAELPRYAAALEQATLERGRLRGIAKKEHDDGKKSDARQSLETAASLADPRHPDFVVGDATAEFVVQRMASTGGRLYVLSDEGSVLSNSFGRYGDENGNFEWLLNGWNGDFIARGRVGRSSDKVNAQQRIKPCPTVYVAAQPSKIREFLATPGTEERGLWARWLFCFPETRKGTRIIDPANLPPKIPANVRSAFQRCVSDILAMPEEKQTLRLEPAAFHLLVEFHNAVEVEIRPGADYDEYGAEFSKIAGLAARVAGLIHVARHHEMTHPSDVAIGIDCIHSAIEIACTSFDHALALKDQGLGAKAERREALRVLPWILSNGPEFDWSTLNQARFKGNASKGHLLRTFLEESRWIAVTKIHTGGKPRIRCRINPLAHEYVNTPGRGRGLSSYLARHPAFPFLRR